MLRTLLAGLAAHLPSQCAVCHAWPARAVCEDCVRCFGQPVHRCATCALPLPAGLHQCGACLRSPPPLDQALAAVPYAYPWAGLLSQFKFHAHTGWAGPLAQLMCSVPEVQPALDAAEWLLPMPLSAPRLQARGYNQALLLARALAPRKLHAALLLRVRDTPPQSGLPRAQRLLAVRGAYALEPALAHTVAGRRVLLVDDVMTTGASLHAAAAMLRRHGAAQVGALVFARAE